MRSMPPTVLMNLATISSAVCAEALAARKVRLANASRNLRMVFSSKGIAEVRNARVHVVGAHAPRGLKATRGPLQTPSTTARTAFAEVTDAGERNRS